MQKFLATILIFSLVISLAVPSGAVFATEEMLTETTTSTDTTNDATLSINVVETTTDDSVEKSGEVAPAEASAPVAISAEAPVAPQVISQPEVSNVVIAQIQVGSASSASDEYISIYNGGVRSVEVTGWCLKNNKNLKFACLNQPGTEYFLEPGAYLGFSSVLPRPGEHGVLVTFASGNHMLAGGDTVSLVNSSDAVQNTMAWTKSDGYGLERTWNLETDQLSGEVVWKTALEVYGRVIKPELVECANGRPVTSLSECDVCSNLPGMSLDMLPPGSEMDDKGDCYVSLLPLAVTEVLPNPDGSDEGNEFVELYNPNERPIDLTWWRFYLNGDTKKFYSFPAGAEVAAESYYVLRNSEVKYALSNSSGSLQLRSFADQHKVDVPNWTSPKSGQAWALVDGEWQYTTTPTPGRSNFITTANDVALLADCGEGRERNPETGRCRNLATAKELAPCRDGQYRSEETGRCRNIALAGSTLQPCKESQYRSEETNRCRSIASAAASTLKPCADGQFRNPETNRCKKIASSDDIALADCGEGRERNPATNRCRNVQTVSSKASVAPQPQETASGWSVWTWTLLAVGVTGAVGYGVYEWRHELASVGRKVVAKLGKK